MQEVVVSHQLPARPNLEHLKAQAKDLLDAHRRGEPEAFERIRASVPAFARMSDDALARAAFALHDAQSAIAREYGFVSWVELRDKVAALTAAPPSPEAILADEAARVVAALGWPPEAAAEINAVASQRDAIRAVPTPATVPMVPLRNAVAFPGAVIPIDITRATSLPAIEAAIATQPRFLAIFAQRAPGTERPTQDELHARGCLCVALYLHRGQAGAPSRVLLQGIRWITLDAIERMEPYYTARVSDAGGIDAGDDQEIAALDRRLREVARRFAHTLPANRDRALAFIEITKDIGQIADVAMANTSVSVSESAAYAEETQLARRLERAIAALDGALARASAAPPPT
jgi:Lon protease-like protein